MLLCALSSWKHYFLSIDIIVTDIIRVSFFCQSFQKAFEIGQLFDVSFSDHAFGKHEEVTYALSRREWLALVFEDLLDSNILKNEDFAYILIN